MDCKKIFKIRIISNFWKKRKIMKFKIFEGVRCERKWVSGIRIVLIFGIFSCC